MSKKKKKNSGGQKRNHAAVASNATNTANTATSSAPAQKREPQKAYTPKTDSKPMILRILVLTLAAVMILGIVVGTFATGAGF